MFDVAVCTAAGKELKRFDLSRLAGTGGRIVVGRAEDCDIRIRSAAVSRHHCAIEWDEGDWLVRDLGSTHGTIVDGVRISEAAVVAGLRVVVASAVLRFEPCAARVAAAAARESR